MTDRAPPPGASTPTYLAGWPSSGATERDNLERELAEARAARSRSMLWTAMFGVGPAAVVAVGLAALTGSLELAAALFGLGVVVEAVRIWRLNRVVRGLTRALEDPMDGS